MTIKNMTIKTRESLGNTYYMIIGDTEEFGEQEILFEGISFNECYWFLSEKCILSEESKVSFLEAHNKELIRLFGMPATDDLYDQYEYIVEYADEYGEKKEDFIYENNNHNAYRIIFKQYKDVLKIYKSLDPDDECGHRIIIYTEKLGKIRYL